MPKLKPFYRRPSGELQPIPFTKPLILCVEDNPIYLHLRKAVFEREGYNVIGVTGMDGALQALREAPICCTIADHMLKGRTGMELAKEMKRIKPDVPIVLFSGTIPEKLENIDVFVNKGEPTAVVLKIIRNVVERYSS